MPEAALAEHDQPGPSLGHDIPRRRLARDQPIAAEHIPELEAAELLATRPIDLREGSGEDHEEPLRRRALSDDARSILHLEQPELTRDRLALRVRERREEEIRADLAIEHARAQETKDALGHARLLPHQRNEYASIDRDELRLDERRHRRVARLLRHDPDLSHEIPALDHRELSPTLALRALGDRNDRALDDEVERVRSITLAKEDLPLREMDDPHTVDQRVETCGLQRLEERKVRELTAER